MRNYLTIVALTVLMGACADSDRTESPSAVRGLDDPDAIVLRVRVVSAEFTEFYNPDAGCPVEDDGTQCIQMYFWYKYKANVLSVEKGKWKGKVVEFANYQHSAYQARYVDDCYAVLVKASADFAARVGVPYISEDLVLPRLDRDRARLRTLLSHGM